MDSLLNNKRMMLNPKYGVIGGFAIPYYFVVEMIGPIIEILGYFSVTASFFFGILNREFALLFFTFSVLYGIFLSISAVMLGDYNFMKYEKVGDYLRMMLFAVLENFGYRQLTVWWRFRAWFGYKRMKNTWGNIERRKFSENS